MMNTIFTYLMTALIPLLGVIFLLQSRRGDDATFFSKDYTDVFKGLCCLIVIYVHVKPERGNMLQDAIGSFAYVAVTFFFLVSAYGMLYGLKKKNDYLEKFWRNRLVSLLIPCFLVNVVGFILGYGIKGEGNIAFA